MTSAQELIAPDFVAPDGRKSWKKNHALDLLDRIRSSGLAILDVRAWLVLKHIYDDMTVTESIHESPKKLRFYSWQPAATWDEESQSWDEFSKACISDARAFLSSGEVEDFCAEALQDNIQYHIELTTRSEYLEED